jgi:hypothetical protein
VTEILNNPKVIPMIRGKSFKFTVQEYLGNLLSNYDVINPRLNPQSGLHDIDVAVIHKSTSSQYSIECKLAKKDSFKNITCPTIEIKCMRSRTLGEEAAKRKSQVTGIVASELMIHNDQYIASDFDLVITSIANAFYKTDENGLFFWCPSQEAEPFLDKLNIKSQEEAFLQMYVARSTDLTANQINKIKCSRKKCNNPNCNFIPNYPKIFFSESGDSLFPWIPIDRIEDLLQSLE